MWRREPQRSQGASEESCKRHMCAKTAAFQQCQSPTGAFRLLSTSRAECTKAASATSWSCHTLLALPRNGPVVTATIEHRTKLGRDAAKTRLRYLVFGATRLEKPGRDNDAGSARKTSPNILGPPPPKRNASTRHMIASFKFRCFALRASTEQAIVGNLGRWSSTCVTRVKQ